MNWKAFILTIIFSFIGFAYCSITNQKVNDLEKITFCYILYLFFRGN